MSNKEQNQVIMMDAGLDIGNGYVKGAISVNGEKETGIDFLSGVAIQTSSHDIKTRANEAQAVVDDLTRWRQALIAQPWRTTRIVCLGAVVFRLESPWKNLTCRLPFRKRRRICPGF